MNKFGDVWFVYDYDSKIIGTGDSLELARKDFADKEKKQAK